MSAAQGSGEVQGLDMPDRADGATSPLGPAVLYVPASNPRALAKAPHSGASALIYDLEDAVAPAAKDAAREALREALGEARSEPGSALPHAIRINGPDHPAHTEDLLAARKLMPRAIVVPKAERGVVAAVHAALEETDAPLSLKLWAMVETPAGVLDLAAIASESPRLEALIVGTNDLAAMTGVSDRAAMRPWLMHVVLVASAHGLLAFDGVANDFRDLETFGTEAAEASAMGFDGKTLIHPSQIAPTLEAFRPSDAELAEAHSIVAAFAEVEDDVGIVTLDGRMVERLHLRTAQRLIARNEAIRTGAKTDPDGDRCMTRTDE